MEPSSLVVVSERDPVATAVRERWGVPPSTGEFVDGAPIRRLSEGALLLGRPVHHIHDERLDLRLPSGWAGRPLTFIFPSIHRSERNVDCLTVHPLGNPGAGAEVGGRPRTYTPTDPPRMTAMLRALAERGPSLGWPATFEATHHGPELGRPAFFVEIGYGDLPAPPEAAVRLLADTIPVVEPSSGDRVAVGVGGGHYVPHFTELAVERRWSFGHLLSRHALAGLDRASARGAWEGTPGAEGVLFARTEDAENPVWSGTGPRLRDGDAPRRGAAGAPTSASRPASGT